MATSGSTNFSLTRNQIVTQILTRLAVVRPGGTPSTNDINYVSEVLNLMVKSWQGKNINLWKMAEGTLFLVSGQNTYDLVETSSDVAGDDAVETNLTADASGTALTVTSTTGMTTGDTIIVELDDNTSHVTTVTVDSTTSLTLDSAVTSTASSGNRVATYTTDVSKPLHISSARFNNSDDTDRPVFIRARDEFMQIPNKTTTGKINQIFYTPKLSDTKVYVWPTPDSCADRLRFSYAKQIQDFDASSDNADFPVEWTECLILNGMAKVAKTYGKDRQDAAEIQQAAAEELLQMQLWDGESGSLRITPNDRDE